MISAWFSTLFQPSRTPSQSAKPDAKYIAERKSHIAFAHRPELEEVKEALAHHQRTSFLWTDDGRAIPAGQCAQRSRLVQNFNSSTDFGNRDDDWPLYYVEVEYTPPATAPATQ